MSDQRREAVARALWEYSGFEDDLSHFFTQADAAIDAARKGKK